MCACTRARTHTEMASVNRGKIVLSLEINLILFCIGAAAECVVSVHQTRYLEVDYTYEAVTMECSFSTQGCPPAEQATSLWFRYGDKEPETLGWGAHAEGAGKFAVKEALKERRVWLTVRSLGRNDSAIYVCGIAFPGSKDARAKQTGAGTALVVRETKVLGDQTQSFLTALLCLLSIYIVAAVVAFIVRSRSKSNSRRNEEKEDSRKKKSARRIFQEIAQELYNKRHMETSQTPEKDNTYENRRPLSNYERP